MMAAPQAQQTVTAIPAELQALPQWVASVNKIPHNPRTGQRASTTDPKTWGTFAEANAYANQHDCGIGFVFSADDPYMGIDLDKCRDAATGMIEEWAQAIISDLDSYTERSPSGTGVHIIVRAIKTGSACKVTNPNVIEMYDQARHFTITGTRLNGTQGQIENRQNAGDALYHRLFPPPPAAAALALQNVNDLGDNELIERMMKGANGSRIRALWRFSRTLDAPKAMSRPPQQRLSRSAPIRATLSRPICVLLGPAARN